ncbi:ragulator complex protein LAMTOR1 [Parasteatoda tepidariorum]|nr:ragulator complex protein LAMTOR1 [Parasteatoda tepidariorum]
MGGCFSCFSGDDNKSLSGEPNERSQLLANPVSNSITRPGFSHDISDVSFGQVGDEQAALNKILHQTAIDIIDVSAIPTHIEQKDYIDRVKGYQRGLAKLHIMWLKRNRGLLKDVPLPEKVTDIVDMQILIADMSLINETFKTVREALEDIEVQPQGDLVSKFGAS